MKESSLCDIIMRESATPVMEVAEHLLHAVTDVGLHYTFPQQWGLTGDSELYALMQEAIAGGYYNIRGYKDLKGAGDIYDRILLQEYAYWAVSSGWDIQTAYGPDEAEWTLTTPAALKKAQPGLVSMMENISGKVMRVPDTGVLEAIGH